MNARDEFYIALSDDLTQKGEESILYKYLEEEQEKKAFREEEGSVGGARSYQLRIRYFRKKLVNGEIILEEYLKRLLSILLQKTKFCKRCGKPEKSLESRRRIGYCSKDPEPLLEELLDAALGGGQSQNRDGFIQRMKSMVDLLNTGKGPEYRNMIQGLRENGFLDVPFKKIMFLTEVVLDVAIAYEIKEFFYGTVVETLEDYSVSKRPKSPNKALTGARPERIDKSLKLIDYYCRKKGKTLFGAGLNGSEPGDKECDILYRKLLESNNNQVFVPLLVDQTTGCGIYIIGKAYFEGDYAGDPGQYRRMEGSCAYGVLAFDNDSGQDIRTGYHINNRFDEFPSFNAARFRGDWSYEKARQDAVDIIKESNGEMPADIPEIFRKYFEEGADQEAERYKREIREAVSRCENALRRKKKSSNK